MGRTVPLALASLVGMNAISPRRLYENCNFDQSVPSRHGFHHFWTQYPPSFYDFSATAGRLISCTICKRHGSESLDRTRRGLAIIGWTARGNRSDRAIGPGFAWTYSRQHFSLPYFYTRRSRNCTRFGIFRIGDLSYLRLPYLLSGHFYGQRFADINRTLCL